ncbi:signal-transduction protein with cAMP-binding, CBS, and nucleotidyltransferase domain [Natronocella acetinitrilica]|uniref:Signal-transduction protein with cAMP-binding, CBS, and nucleotidyltransferase domain n=1 Tax=Natronocella acetinitrilica TaxID=414046 RepID=A0AAE3G1P1_9GAMM|nr:DUF294 nucleotidyltransferase-like domain-containing protein [Natronocella acetinitrilica]MCP1673787.1 signal-transduction protein with cAMP-binding, CBS, and nucleotidyltransferase domain [Natronocella acetinitrilica]
MTRLTTLLTLTAGRLARRAPVTCGVTTPLHELLPRLAEAVVCHAVVLDRERQIRGLIGPVELLSRLRGPDAPALTAGEIMDQGVRAVPAGEPLYRLFGTLRQGRPLAVVDDDGGLVGLLSAEQFMDAALPSSLGSGPNFPQADTTEALDALKRSQVAIAADLLAEKVPATDIQRLLSALNDDLYRRVLSRVIAGLDADGWGRPPVAFAVIVMGSGGRRESLLAPDQDNGLVIDDYPDEQHAAVDSYFAELGHRLAVRLDRVGIPLCTGHVMASNPLWRKARSQWLAQIRGWMRHRSNQGLLNACILLDMRAVAGELSLADAVREAMVDAVARSPGFLRALTLNESTKEVGLGWFDRLIPEGGEGPHAGELNIKRNGIMPIVEAIRLYALSRGLTETGTLERLGRLGEAGLLDRHDLDALSHAYGYMCFLLLRQQAADMRAGRPPGRHVPPDSLTRRENDTLVRSMKASQALLRRLHADLVGSGV